MAKLLAYDLSRCDLSAWALVGHLRAILHNKAKHQARLQRPGYVTNMRVTQPAVLILAAV